MRYEKVSLWQALITGPISVFSDVRINSTCLESSASSSGSPFLPISAENIGSALSSNITLSIVAQLSRRRRRHWRQTTRACVVAQMTAAGAATVTIAPPEQVSAITRAKYVLSSCRAESTLPRAGNEEQIIRTAYRAIWLTSRK